MKRVMKQLLPGLAAVLLAGAAQAGSGGLAGPDEPHGVVRTDVQRSAEQIFPVRIVEIDGDLVSTDDQVAVWLTPGEHTLKVRGTLEQDNATGLQRTVGHGRGKNEVTVNVEAGKTYYVGGKKSPDTDNVWTPVVWRVVESES